MDRNAWICDAARTPIGRYGGALSSVRTDDLAAIPLQALLGRNPGLAPDAIDDVLMGCANQAGEDNRNVARMALLLAGLPDSVPGATVNRLCGSGMNAVGNGADAIKAGHANVILAGGVESMSRAPFVIAKPTTAFDRNAEMYDTTLGWRFVNRKLEEQYGVDSMAETAENVAADYSISRADQDQFALRSQQRAVAAISAGRLAEEIVTVQVAQRQRRSDRSRHRRTPARRFQPRSAGETQADRARGRYGHGRQRFRHQRWSLRAPDRIGPGGKGSRLDATGQDRRLGRGRRALRG